MAKSSETVDVKITSAIVIAGRVVKPGEVVTLPKKLAEELMNRKGKVVLFTSEMAAAAAKKAAADKAAADKAAGAKAAKG